MSISYFYLFIYFFSVFRCFFLYISSLLVLFMMIFLTFAKVSICLVKTLSFFIKKEIRLFSSKCLLYITTCSWNMHKSLRFFRIFVSNEIFKTLFNKRKFIRYYYFINIYIVCQNRAFILMKFVLFNFKIIIFYNIFVCFYIRL